MADPLHLQISGDLPWCVLGWRTFEHEDIPPDLASVYGPVPSKEAAERLIEALAQLIPDSEAAMKFTVMPVFPVMPPPAASGAAPS